MILARLATKITFRNPNYLLRIKGSCSNGAEKWDQKVSVRQPVENCANS